MWRISHIFIFLLATLALASAQNPQPQPFRSWYSTAGTELRAALVNWSDFDLTLQKTDGGVITVPLDQISGSDLIYLQEKESLKVEKNPEQLPWIDIDAIVKSRSRNTYYDITGARYDRRDIKMLVELDNLSDDDITVDVIWMFYADRMRSSGKVKSPEDYYPFAIEEASIKLARRSDLTFETAKVQKTARGYGQPDKSGSKIKGFVIQAYWKGHFLKGFASHPMLEGFADDPDLRDDLSR